MEWGQKKGNTSGGSPPPSTPTPTDAEAARLPAARRENQRAGVAGASVTRAAGAGARQRKAESEVEAAVPAGLGRDGPRCTLLPRPPVNSSVPSSPSSASLWQCFPVVMKFPISSVSQVQQLRTHSLPALAARSPRPTTGLRSFQEGRGHRTCPWPLPRSGAARTPWLGGSDLCLRGTCPSHLLPVHVPLTSLLQGCVGRSLGCTQITTHGSLLI